MAYLIHSIRNHRLLAIVLLIGFIATLSYAFYFKVKVAVDARAYDSIAWSLVQGTGYTETTSPIPNSAIGRLGPGYEFFLAFWYWIFGHRLWVIWIIQSLLHVGSAFFIYRFVRRLYDGPHAERWAVGGAGFYLFFIDVLEFPAMLMTETLYLFLVLAGTWYALDVFEKPSIRNVSSTSVLLTLALLVRPPVAILMFVIFGFLLFKKHWRHAMIFGAIAVVLLAPWMIRNWMVYHRFIVTSSILGYDVWVGNSPDSKHVGELTATEEIDRYSEQEGLFAANDRGLREVKNLIFEQPWEYIKLQLTKTSIYFSAARPAAFWFHLKGASQLLTIIFSSSFAYVLFIAGLSGLYYFARHGNFLQRMFVLCALAAPAGIIWVVAETRYRYQFYPMIIVLGVLFLAEYSKNKRYMRTILVIVAVLVTANLGLDVATNMPRIRERIEKVVVQQAPWL